MTHSALARIGGPPEHVLYFADPTLPYCLPLVHSTAVVQPFVTVDSGIKAPTRVGARTLLLAHVHIGHDAIVGDDCQIATGTVVGGHATIGDWVKVGINATILPFRVIGDGATIGAGSVVTRDVPAGETWVGNPARRLEDSERDPRVHSQRVAGNEGMPLPYDPPRDMGALFADVQVHTWGLD